MKRDCVTCRYLNTNFDQLPCSACSRFSKWETATNADYIRSMTDEELAEFLGDATYKENEQGYPIMRTVNKVWWHKWLKQPYGGDT